MAGCELQPGKPGLTREPMNDAFYSAIISVNGCFVGENERIPFSGTMTLSWSKQSYLSMASSMLMEDFKDFNEEIKDMGMEIANMTVGGAKKILRPKGFEIDMSIPSCVVGDAHRLDVKKGVITIGVPMNDDHGGLRLELNYLEMPNSDMEAA